MSTFKLRWNGSIVKRSKSEKNFMDFLRNEVGMDEVFISDNMNKGQVEVTYNDGECERGWKWSCEYGDNYVDVELIKED